MFTLDSFPKNLELCVLVSTDTMPSLESKQDNFLEDLWSGNSAE